MKLCVLVKNSAGKIKKTATYICGFLFLVQFWVSISVRALVCACIYIINIIKITENNTYAWKGEMVLKPSWLSKQLTLLLLLCNSFLLLCYSQWQEFPRILLWGGNYFFPTVIVFPPQIMFKCVFFYFQMGLITGSCMGIGPQAVQ